MIFWNIWGQAFGYAFSLIFTSAILSSPSLVSYDKTVAGNGFTEDFICKHGVPKTQMCSISVDVFIDSEHPIIFEDYIIILIMLLKYNQF